MARSPPAHSCVSSTRISMAPRSNRAIAPRALTHSWRSIAVGIQRLQVAVDAVRECDRGIPARSLTGSGTTRPVTDGTRRAFSLYSAMRASSHGETLAVHEGRACRQRRQQRQYEPDRRMQPPELGIIARTADSGACSAGSTSHGRGCRRCDRTPVDLAVLVRPEPRLRSTARRGDACRRAAAVAPLTAVWRSLRARRHRSVR
jgi:hypothetical protein